MNDLKVPRDYFCDTFETWACLYNPEVSIGGSNAGTRNAIFGKKVAK